MTRAYRLRKWTATRFLPGDDKIDISASNAIGETLILVIHDCYSDIAKAFLHYLIKKLLKLRFIDRRVAIVKLPVLILTEAGQKVSSLCVL